MDRFHDHENGRSARHRGEHNRRYRGSDNWRMDYELVRRKWCNGLQRVQLHRGALRSKRAYRRSEGLAGLDGTRSRITFSYLFAFSW